MMYNLLDALQGASLAHVLLVTGTKQYLGAFENFGSGKTETPFRESAPRVPGENFYYTLEDIMSRRRSGTASVGTCTVRTRSSAMPGATP